MSRTSRVFLLPLATALLLAPPTPADSIYSTERQLVKLADGVYMIRHKDPFPGWVHGNTTVIVGDRQVFVVDSCQTLSAANEDIAQIRKWTDKPVAYVLNTHWHQDHNAGNKAYIDAFPAVAILAHPETRAMMDRTSPGIVATMLKQASEIQANQKKRLETGKSSDGKPLTEAQRAESQERLAEAEAIIEQAHSFVYQSPTLMSDGEMTLDLGNRVVKVMHLGRGNTGGDVVAYLPKEKVLATGDLVVRPVPYTFDGYPSEWIKTLENLARLDAETIVPGHGDVMHDKVFLNALIEMMRSVVAQVNDKVRGDFPDISVEDLRKAVDLKAFRDRMCGNDKRAANFFDYSVGNKFVELAYYEAKAR